MRGKPRGSLRGAGLVVASLGLLLVATAEARAQESASFDLEEHALNSGGSPAGGVVLGSPSFRVTLSALGDTVRSAALSGVSFAIDGGLVSAYPPPGEVLGLRFADRDTLIWDAEPSAGVYHIYRGALTDVGGPGYGVCLPQSPSATTADDPAVPLVGAGFFYLITVENRLGEQGTKGFRSDGAERQGNVCP